MMKPDLSLSIVVHRQADLARKLLEDLNAIDDIKFEVLLTINVAESLPFAVDDFQFPIVLIRNSVPQGFGANHNAAFRRIEGRYFCVINPDIRLCENPFSKLTAVIDSGRVAVVAPHIRNMEGHQEDNVRYFPTPTCIIAKLIGIWPRIEYPSRKQPFECEWVAGMFMLFAPEIFLAVGGFDERYHLYYEDVDICARLKIAGHRIVACPNVDVIHSARRKSHQNLRFMKWHLQSMLRFFLSKTYRRALALRSF